MRTRFSSIAIVLGFLLASVESFASDQLVTTTGTDSPDCSIVPCATVATALDNAVSGDTVKIAAGAYDGASSRVQYGGSLELTISGGWTSDFSAQDPLLVTKLVGPSHAGSAALGFGAIDDATLILNIDHLTIASKKSSGFGMLVTASTEGLGELNNVTLTFDHVVVEKNKSSLTAYVSAVLGSVSVGIHDCTFSKNKPKSGNGALDFFLGTATLDVTIENSTFFKNTSDGGGAAFNVHSEASSPHDGVATITMRDTTFSKNKSGGSGGAIYLEASDQNQIDLDLSSVSFVGNKTADQGGAIFVLAQDVLTAGGVDVAIVNGVFSKNSAAVSGGSIAVTTSGGDANASLSLRNSSFSYGKADVFGTGLFLSGTGGNVSANILNTVVWGDKGTAQGSLAIEGLVAADVTLTNSDLETIFGSVTNGGGNLTVNPVFLKGDASLHLDPASPLRDVGTCTGVPALDTDIDGDARPTGAGCDIGADELNP